MCGRLRLQNTTRGVLIRHLRVPRIPRGLDQSAEVTDACSPYQLQSQGEGVRRLTVGRRHQLLPMKVIRGSSAPTSVSIIDTVATM